jgi:hypothetical protein
MVTILLTAFRKSIHICVIFSVACVTPNLDGLTYLLHKSDAGWRIHEIIATDLDKLAQRRLSGMLVLHHPLPSRSPSR